MSKEYRDADWLKEQYHECAKSCHDAVLIHRLIVVAEYGMDVVNGMEVHHKNRIPWDNRPKNLEVLSKAEHTRLHNLAGEKR